MSRTITFPKVTPEQWNETKIAIQKDSGLTITGDEGESEAKGIRYSYKYDPEDLTLTIEEISRSWFDPSEDVIAQKIHDGVESVLKQD